MQDEEATNVFDHDTDDISAEVDGFMFLNLESTSKLNAWAGPDHWKFRKVSGKPLLLSYRSFLIPEIFSFFSCFNKKIYTLLQVWRMLRRKLDHQ